MKDKCIWCGKEFEPPPLPELPPLLGIKPPPPPHRLVCPDCTLSLGLRAGGEILKIAAEVFESQRKEQGR